MSSNERGEFASVYENGLTLGGVPVSEVLGA